MKDILKKVADVRGLLSALCAPRGTTGAREWTMSIPARASDPDLIIADLLNDVEKYFKKPRLPVGVSVLITDHLGRVLLGKRLNNSGGGLLSTPGGCLEEHENMFQCAEREVLEELDVHVKTKELHILGFKEHFRFGNHYFMIYMHAARYYGLIKNTEPEKCESWDWHELDSIAPTTTTEPIEILEHLKARLEAL